MIVFSNISNRSKSILVLTNCDLVGIRIIIVYVLLSASNMCRPLATTSTQAMYTILGLLPSPMSVRVNAKFDVRVRVQ